MVQISRSKAKWASPTHSTWLSTQSTAITIVALSGERRVGSVSRSIRKAVANDNQLGLAVIRFRRAGTARRAEPPGTKRGGPVCPKFALSRPPFEGENHKKARPVAAIHYRKRS